MKMRNQNQKRAMIAAAIGGLFVAVPLHATTVALLPTQWNFIASGSFAGQSDGGGYHTFVGGSAGVGREALLQFDLSSIPAGATITSATMTMYMDRSQVSVPANQPVFMYRLTSSWGMGNSGVGQGDNGINGGGGSGFTASNIDATWNYRFYNAANPAASIPWTTVGGDFASTVSATAQVGSGFPTTGTQGPGGPILSTWSGSGLVSDVQNWLSGAQANDGWLFTDFASATDFPPSGNAFASDQARRFISPSNNLDGTAGTSDDRPYLTLTFTPVPEPTTVCLLGVFCVPVLLRRRSRN